MNLWWSPQTLRICPGQLSAMHRFPSTAPSSARPSPYLLVARSSAKPSRPVLKGKASTTVRCRPSHRSPIPCLELGARVLRRNVHACRFATSGRRRTVLARGEAVPGAASMSSSYGRPWLSKLALLWLAALPSACSEPASDEAALRTSARVASHVVISPPSLDNATAPIPGNGGLLIWSQLSDPFVTVSSLDAPGTTFGGTVAPLHVPYSVWTATEPLMPGRYTVHVSTTAGGGQAVAEEIEVTDERVFAPPMLTSDPTVSIEQTQHEIECCWTMSGGARVSTSCFSSANVDGISMFTGLATTESPSALTQLLFLIAAVYPDGSYADPSLFHGSTQLRFPREAEEYCYSVTATEIATGELYSFDELIRCVPHGDLPALGSHPVEVADSELDRLICDAPPEGFEERWCTLNEADCDAAGNRPGCLYVGHVCRGEALPPEPPMPVFASGGVGGATAGASGEALSGGAGGRAGYVEPSRPVVIRERAASCNVERPNAVKSGDTLGAGSVLACLALFVLSFRARQRRLKVKRRLKVELPSKREALGQRDPRNRLSDRRQRLDGDGLRRHAGR